MRSKRVLLLFEPGRGGAAALERARELVEHDHAALTVVGLAPQAPLGTCGATSARAYNDAVVDSVVDDLESARARLGEIGAEAAYRLLIEGVEPSLEQFTADGDFELVLLPARRRPLRAASHPAAPRLRRAGAGAEVRIVGPRRAGASG
jgi:hypothetical protein